MYCIECGRILANNSKFCRYCGTRQPIEEDEYIPPVTIGRPVQKEEIAPAPVVEEIVEAPAASAVEEVIEVPAAPVVEGIVEAPAAPAVEEVIEVPAASAVEEVIEAPAAPVVEEIVEAPAAPAAEEVIEAPAAPVVEEVIEKKPIIVNAEELGPIVIETPLVPPIPDAAPRAAEAPVELPEAYLKLESGREIKLDRSRYSVGRVLGNDIIFDNPAVSRRHAVFEFDDGEWFITDSGSTNGVKVNGERLDKGERCSLMDGDLIVVAKQIKLFFSQPEPELEPQPEPVEIIEEPAKPEPVEIIEAPAKPEPVEIIEAPAKPEPVEIIEAPAKPEPVEKIVLHSEPEEVIEAPAKPEPIQKTMLMTEPELAQRTMLMSDLGQAAEKGTVYDPYEATGILTADEPKYDPYEATGILTADEPKYDPYEATGILTADEPKYDPYEATGILTADEPKYDPYEATGILTADEPKYDPYEATGILTADEPKPDSGEATGLLNGDEGKTGLLNGNDAGGSIHFVVNKNYAAQAKPATGQVLHADDPAKETTPVRKEAVTMLVSTPMNEPDGTMVINKPVINVTGPVSAAQTGSGTGGINGSTGSINGSRDAARYEFETRFTCAGQTYNNGKVEIMGDHISLIAVNEISGRAQNVKRFLAKDIIAYNSSFFLGRGKLKIDLRMDSIVINGDKALLAEISDLLDKLKGGKAAPAAPMSRPTPAAPVSRPTPAANQSSDGMKYACKRCGAKFPGWHDTCPSCGNKNTILPIK